MGFRVLLVSFVVLGITSAAPKADFGYDGGHNEHHEDHKAEDTVPQEQCKLERASSATSQECFLEPECHNSCNDVTNQVCTPYEENECQSFDVHSCNTIQEEKCETVVKTV